MTIGRPPNVMRPSRVEVRLPEDLRARLDLYLYSQLENRIPLGAYAKFFTERVKEFFDGQTELTRLKKRIEEAEIYEGYSESQREALEAYRDHILSR